MRRRTWLSVASVVVLAPMPFTAYGQTSASGVSSVEASAVPADWGAWQVAVVVPEG
jgi:hypothetical protein